MAKRLTRKNGKIFGVCEGLGVYWDIDPTMVRLGFVLGSLFAGFGLVPYIIMAIVMPKE